MTLFARFRWPLVVLAIFLPAATARADGPQRLNLIVPDSLAGWDQGPPVKGWHAEGSMLIANVGASTLTSAWTFGDFSLAFQWQTGGNAALIVSLPEVPSGPAIDLHLAEGETDLKLTAPGAAAPMVATATKPTGPMHVTEIDRAGDRLTVRVDGKQLGEIQVDPAKRYGLLLSLEGGDVRRSSNDAEITAITIQEPAGEPIFNGRDLTGWWSPLGLKSWQGKDGVIECLHKDGNYLRTDKSYGNFTLSLEYLASRHCNSGIGIRTAHDGWPSGEGFELQIYDEPGLGHDSTMAIYRNVEPLARADRTQQWNRVVIKADGAMISAWVNGQLVQQANTAFHPELRHRHAAGWIGLQDHGGKIEFRNLNVLAAPDGRGLDAWYEPRIASGPELVCDRLLNVERLSLADGITAGAASVETGTPDGSVLAELTGPGAVTQIWQLGAGGKLAFYFDGESQPSIECDSDELADEIPTLFAQKNPLPTCIPYAKSLKIVRRQAKGPVPHHIEFVTFPAGVPVETFRPEHPILPRGWLAAIDYRGHQFGWGTLRDNDPDPRSSGETKTLDPGQSTTLVTRPGKGIVQWLKLQTNVTNLAKDDLWLEVLIDGEAEPALAAPARYFFPSLFGGTNHDNFLAVFREGFASLLAMPFGDGITIRARNAGKKPLGRVAVTLSVIEDEGGTWQKESLHIDQRLRLRGKFIQADDSPQWLEWKGSGRWVGLVAEQPADDSPAVTSLTIDGQPVSGWGHVLFATMLGINPGDTDFFGIESGRSHGLAWRYWQLAPLEFQNSIVVSGTKPLGNRLVLVYVR